VKERPMHDAPYHTLRRHGEQLILTHRKREASTMAGMRDYNDTEIDLVRKSFSGRYALRDRCFFEMVLQMGLRVSEMLSLTVGQVYQYGKVVAEVSIERKHMKGGKTGKASGRTIPFFPEPHPHILAWLVRLAEMLKMKDPKAIDPSTPLFLWRVHNKDGSPRAIARETAWRIIKAIARENELSEKMGTHSTRSLGRGGASPVLSFFRYEELVQRRVRAVGTRHIQQYLRHGDACP
jgi:site-specific recombinase XerD